ncbi:MAG TPA: carboxypeptidase regulatory-like domain-containing protein [Pyrinomonadaceae bacterium]|jgi:glucose/arabinose dehydrogenase|nr:carboxypeptidase regulatory-like domain-containing protein [Pyrinomonadaceae bacterium]
MSSKRARMLVALFVALCLLSLTFACSKGEDDEEEDEAADTQGPTGIKYAPTGNEGTLSGSVAFTGEAPAPKTISMDQDAVCSQTNPNAVAEDISIKDGKVQNVFVYVKDGKTADGKDIKLLAFDPPAQATVLDQKGCQYVPHILGIQTRQKLSVTNSDQTTHNINLQAKSNPSFNQSQTQGAAPIEKTFNRAEVIIPVKCNQHPWMKSYVAVLGHPFHAVSGPDGKFEIKGLPPGTYTVVAWHERMKEQTQSVTVAAKESKTQDFTFTSATAANTVQGGSLEMMPALELPMIGGHPHH